MHKLTVFIVDSIYCSIHKYLATWWKKELKFACDFRLVSFIDQ